MCMCVLMVYELFCVNGFNPIERSIIELCVCNRPDGVGWGEVKGFVLASWVHRPFPIPFGWIQRKQHIDRGSWDEWSS